MPGYVSCPVAVAALTTDEVTAAAEFDRMGKENKIEETLRGSCCSGPVSSAGLLDALWMYPSKMEEQCIAKAEEVGWLVCQTN